RQVVTCAKPQIVRDLNCHLQPRNFSTAYPDRTYCMCQGVVIWATWCPWGRLRTRRLPGGGWAPGAVRGRARLHLMSRGGTQTEERARRQLKRRRRRRQAPNLSRG